jgi:hypothetical protein
MSITVEGYKTVPSITCKRCGVKLFPTSAMTAHLLKHQEEDRVEAQLNSSLKKYWDVEEEEETHDNAA